ncbi:MAG TPA: hypothetical protein VJZ00_11690 [Thermoanaerobaculia bacterium]|nr:hypothetical protein [Thermoanaerobaculia bacterium]
MTLTASSTSIMSQDVIATADVLLDSTSARPVGIFINPAHGEAEAFGIIAETSGGARKIGHVARDASSESGWSVKPVAGGIEDAVEVACGTVGGAAFGVYTNASMTYGVQLQSDGTWSSPQMLSPQPISHLRAAYTPDQRLVVYGVDPFGNLATMFQQVAGGALVLYLTDLGGVLSGGDFSFVLTSHVDWSLVANVSGAPRMWTSQLGTGSAQASTPQFHGGAALAHIVSGYWSDANQALMFFYTDTSNQMYVWWSAGGTASNIPFPGSVVTTSAMHVSTDTSVHLYTVDDQANLSVLHQDGNNPWNGDGSPNFSPFIGLDRNISGVVCDMNPADAPALFALDAATNSLRLHTQDAQTMMWSCGSLLQSARQTYEVVRFRTEVVVTDENGTPVANHPVTLTAAANNSSSVVSCGGSSYVVDSNGASMTTDVMGRLTFATLVNGRMVAPNVVLSAQNLATPLMIAPSGPVHTYLSGGAEKLNPTNPGGPPPQFDAAGNALANATTPKGEKVVKTANVGLLPTAAAAIQHTAHAGLGMNPSGVAGFAFDFRPGAAQGFKVFTSHDDLTAHVATLKERPLVDIWGDIEQWAGDVYHAVENGFLLIEQAAISVADSIATFTTKLANGIEQAVSVVITSLEQAASIIAGVFRAIEAEIEAIIDWLKGLFDFQSIWNTKTVIERAVASMPQVIGGLISTAEGKVDHWFESQEAAVTAAFARWKSELGTATIGQQLGFPTPGGSSPVPGVSSISSLTNDVHHNWFMDKLTSLAPDFSGGTGADQAFERFVTNVSTDVESFLTTELTALGNWFVQTISNPASFASLTIATLLSMLEGLVVAALRLADAVVDGLLDLAGAVMSALTDLLATPLDFGFFNFLWDWITSGLTPSGGDLTIGAVISLLLAFPVTLIYKLVKGADSEPFPGGRMQGMESAMSSAMLASTQPRADLLAAAIIQVVYAIPATIASGLGRAAPTWLTLMLAAASITIWILRNGIPSWSSLEWASFAVVCANLAWILPVIAIVLTGTYGTATVTAAGSAVVKVLLTLYGIVTLIIAGVTFHSMNKAEESASILLPLPSLVAFLGLPPFLPEGNVVSAIVTAAGLIGGGVAEIIDSK